MDESNSKVGRVMIVTAFIRDLLIGAIPAVKQRKGIRASLPVELSAGRCVSVWPVASNAWNQNWNTGNPGNQNNNNKNNTNRARAVRRPKALSYASS